MEKAEAREARKTRVKEAREKWTGAPAHVKAMAGAYMGPVLSAIEAISADLEALHQREGEKHE